MATYFRAGFSFLAVFLTFCQFGSAGYQSSFAGLIKQ
jgi:hypothetical protein